MGANNDRERANQYASWLIERKARELIATGLFPELEEEDIEQELLMAVFLGVPHYNPVRSALKTFINRIVCHRIAGLIEARKAAKRGYGCHTCSLDEEIEDEDGETTSLHELLDAEACFRRAGWSGRSSENQIGLKLDVDKTISSLPPELRETCERLKTQRVSEASEAMGIARSSVYRKIEQIRKIFKAKGLNEYL